MDGNQEICRTHKSFQESMFHNNSDHHRVHIRLTSNNWNRTGHKIHLINSRSNFQYHNRNLKYMEWEHKLLFCATRKHHSLPKMDENRESCCIHKSFQKGMFLNHSHHHRFRIHLCHNTRNRTGHKIRWINSRSNFQYHNRNLRYMEG